uniref:Uncharacterized protein n=1 Tax=Arundo donax TaxID=35708 RepID=A0A0A9CEY8_ARUDO
MTLVNFSCYCTKILMCFAHIFFRHTRVLFVSMSNLSLSCLSDIFSSNGVEPQILMPVLIVEWLSVILFLSI